MGGKVVDRHIDALSFFQPLERGCQQGNVEGVGVIKVVFVPSSPFMLLRV